MPKYPISDEQLADLQDRFTYHSPLPGQPERYGAIRARAHELALLIAGETPKSREQSLALTKLDEVVMHVNSAIARNEKDVPARTTPGFQETATE